jgi:hypothetical protein
LRADSGQICQPMSEAQPETREELVQHLEKLTGRTLRTREDIQAYVREVSARKASDQPAVQRWLKTQRITLAALLAFGVLQCYILDCVARDRVNAQPYVLRAGDHAGDPEIELDRLG